MLKFLQAIEKNGGGNRNRTRDILLAKENTLFRYTRSFIAESLGFLGLEGSFQERKARSKSIKNATNEQLAVTDLPRRRFHHV